MVKWLQMEHRVGAGPTQSSTIVSFLGRRWRLQPSAAMTWLKFRLSSQALLWNTRMVPGAGAAMREGCLNPGLAR